MASNIPTVSSTPSPGPESKERANRLPTLFEILSRRTTAPVDLFSFYIYMRDQQRSVDYLDFWLDVSQHMSLCRHYVRELRRSVMLPTPELEKSASKRSSAAIDNVDITEIAGPSGTKDMEKDKDKDMSSTQRLSAFLRQENANHSPQNSHGSADTEHSTPALERPRPSFMASAATSPGQHSSPGQISDSPAHAVARTDIRASAEKILYTYLLPGSEREIILPQSILNDVIHAIEEEKRDDPEVFDAAKDYVFQAMERDACPGFLRAKAFGNLIPPSMMLRLILGLLSMFGGFWTAFILIFLDYSRSTRCWLILPFTIGTYCLMSHQYMLDPIVALSGFSEYTFMSFSRVHEPFVKKMFLRRSFTVLGWVLLLDAALCCLFIFVPGKRL